MIRIGVSALLAAALIGAAPAPQATGRIAWVTDGDTVRLESGERIRIAGVDAPETQPGNAKCKAELARGKAATAKAVTLLRGRTVTVERVGRSYNRTVARIRLHGRDVAALLVDRGAARWWPRGKPKPDWCG
jgi:endonuclease YncB( thermonuclease family)